MIGRPTKQRICHQCGRTGNGSVLFPPYHKGLCRDCVTSNRKNASDNLLQRPCKVCGKPMRSKDKRQVTCSLECGHAGRIKPTVELGCSVCGKTVTRYASALEKRDQFACSPECQRVIAGRAGKDLKKASERAKTKWYRGRSLQRRRANKWWARCCDQSSMLLDKNDDDRWIRRCRSAATQLRYRSHETVKHKQKELPETWQEAIIKAFVMKKQQPPEIWSKKCASVASNLKLRKRKQTRAN